MRKLSRLGQWDGPRPPARGLGSFAALRQRPVLARVGVVLVAVTALAALAYLWGLPLPYRIGEVWGHDVRARLTFEVENKARTEEARDEAVRKLPPEVRGDRAVCDLVRQSVAPVTEVYKKDEVLLQRGQQITEAQRNLMRQETRAYQNSLSFKDKARRALALFLLMGMLALIASLYAVRFQPKIARNTAHIARVCAVVFLAHFCWLLLARPPWHGGLFSLTAAAMVLAIAFRPQFALMTCFCYCVAITSSRGNGMDHLLVEIGGQAIAILLTRNVRSRTQLVKIGVVAGLGYVGMTLATGLLTHQTGPMIAHDAGRRFAWGLAAGFLVTGCLPLIERWFGIVTNIRLLELADGTHPLLQELVRRAPGSYNHSMTVATLAEHAAEAVGANALLTRVGAYFHDIGKMLKPAYFIENQNGQNLHDTLEPGLSTLIIIGHVKDGAALAQQYDLPQPIIDFIQQHHGTTLVEYFYRAALRIQDAHGASTSIPDGSPCTLESSFRYPGPKPQSREIGIVMLTDAVESASRALSDPTPGSLRKLVRDLLMKRLLDGQFEESGLTLTELHQIEESLCKGLTALYHSRIKYPESRERRAA